MLASSNEIGDDRSNGFVCGDAALVSSDVLDFLASGENNVEDFLACGAVCLSERLLLSGSSQSDW